MQKIVAQLRTYGPNCLLWVRVGKAAHPPGSVRRLSEGLLQGFVSRVGTYDGDPSLPVAEWVAVCANAYRLWRDAEPPTAPLDNLLSRTTAMLAPRWIAEPATVTRPLDEPGPTEGLVLEHRLETTEPASVYHVHLPIASGGSYVFSAWIRISESFRGRRIGALLHGFATLTAWPADVAAKSRGQWQRIWVSGKLPTDVLSIACGIVAEGEAGDVFVSTSWCLERGTRPSGYGFVL